MKAQTETVQTEQKTINPIVITVLDTKAQSDLKRLETKDKELTEFMQDDAVKVKQGKNIVYMSALDNDYLKDLKTIEQKSKGSLKTLVALKRQAKTSQYINATIKAQATTQ